MSESTHRRWIAAVAAVFFAHGIGISTILSRMPAIRDHLGIAPGRVGLLLLFFAVGGIGGLSVAGAVVHRIGTRAVNRFAVIAIGVLLALIGASVAVAHSYSLAVAFALVLGVNIGLGDVAMNVSGAGVERHTGKVWLPRFHAAFSLGTIVGAGLGSLAARAGLGIGWHASAIGVVMVAIALLASRHLPPDPAEDDHPEDAPASKPLPAIWREPITIAIGLMTLGFAYAEGGAGDWLAISLTDGHGTSQATGALMLGVFNTAMLTSRLTATPLLERHGRTTVLATSAGVGAVGVALVIWAEPFPLVVLGVVLWGLGAALGFPTGMSAAADDPRNAAKRVSVVATLGYVGFLAGPTVVGFVADWTGFPEALVVVVVFMAFAGALTPSVRQRERPAAVGG